MVNTPDEFKILSRREKKELNAQQGKVGSNPSITFILSHAKGIAINHDLPFLVLEAGIKNSRFSICLEGCFLKWVDHLFIINKRVNI